MKTCIETGLRKIEDIAASSHSIASRNLEDHLDRSLKNHGFTAIQLPYNFAMREACTARNRQSDRKVRSTLEAAADLGLTVMASASMLQSRLSRNLPGLLSEHLPGLDSDSQRAIQFVRSTPGITTALFGWSRTSHVEGNLRLAGIAPAPADTIQTLLNAA